MDVTIVLAISILLQLTAAFLALRLIQITGRWQAWTLIAAAIFLMTVRRSITFYRLISGSLTYRPDLLAELVALTISVLMVAGVAWIVDLFLSVRRSKEALVEAHSELEHAKQYFQSLIESSPDAIISTNREGSITFFSPGAEALLAYKQAEIVGRCIVDLYESEAQAKELMTCMREGNGSISGFETTLRAKDGNLIPVLISSSLLFDEKCHEVGTVGFSKDLRERKKSEEELKAAHEELRRAYDKLERAQASAPTTEKLATLGRLTASVSHEILNPLNVITMNLFMLINDTDTPQGILKDLRDMDEQAKRIVKIAQDFLYFSRQRPPERTRLDFNETVKRAFNLLEHELKLGNVEVKMNLYEKLPPVYADKDQIQQVVLNLLTNARDAMSHGGRLAISTGEVQEDYGRFVEFRVEDTGAGIPPESMDKIFEPFFTTKAEGKGTGLGLAICKGIVESHSGSIWTENVPGSGAAFVVRLNAQGN